MKKNKEKEYYKEFSSYVYKMAPVKREKYLENYQKYKG